MGNSLQDQLKALGLAREKPVSGKSGKKPARSNKDRPPRTKKNSGEMSLEKAFALRKQEEKRSAERAKQLKREADLERKRLNAAVKEIVKPHRLNRDDADIVRNFLFRGRIRKVNVTPEQLKSLNAGELGVVYLSGGYHLLPREHADAVKQLSADHVVDLAEGAADEDGDFPVPDDLIW
jgi:uncharacterized protein YaiL (DUF2058 family)